MATKIDSPVNGTGWLLLLTLGLLADGKDSIAVRQKEVCDMINLNQFSLRLQSRRLEYHGFIELQRPDETEQGWYLKPITYVFTDKAKEFFAAFPLPYETQR